MLWLPGFRRLLLADPKRLGRWGERCCEKFLKAKGFKTVTRNFSCKTGELDLIVSSDRDGAIVFVEVKTRRNENYARAQDAVNPGKQRKMIRTARHFLKAYSINDKPLRFDVVAVILGEKGPPQIRHYENAFTP